VIAGMLSLISCQGLSLGPGHYVLSAEQSIRKSMAHLIGNTEVLSPNNYTVRHPIFRFCNITEDMETIFVLLDVFVNSDWLCG
jgi:hypothetical protein